MIDTSHGNSGKDFRRQPVVASAIADQVAAGEPGIIGVMLESFLVDGRQDLTDRTRLTIGQSITDACMGWDMTVPVLHELASAVRARRPVPPPGDFLPAVPDPRASCESPAARRSRRRFCPNRALRPVSPMWETSGNDDYSPTD